jgi:hypothetical protein
MVDNQPAIALAKNPGLYDCSKHIDTCFHFIHGCVDGGQIVLETARRHPHLGHLRFMELRTNFGMVEIKQEQQDQGKNC